MYSSDDSFATYGDLLYIVRKHKETQALNIQRNRTRLFLIMGSLVLLMVFVGLAGCAAPESPDQATVTPTAVEVAGTLPASATATPDPVETTEAFYAWYFDYIGEPGSDNFRNPLVDRAYRQSEYLSANLIEEVDDLLNSFEGGGYDPFLMAQDFPREVEAEAWEENGDSARVIVHQHWGERVRDLAVDLVREDGHWLIEAIQPGSPTTPEGTTELFYHWYLGYIGERDAGKFRNPLADGAYRDSEYLSDTFVQRVDEILASAEGGGYDPILQAQDIPHAVSAGLPEVAGNQATVKVERYWAGNPNSSPIIVSLVREGRRWLIDDVVEQGEAPTMLPAEVVEAFYAQWRLAVRGDMRNSEESPLSTGAYHNSSFLTDAFKERVDEIVAGMEHGAYDPFLCAQDVPNKIKPVTTFMGPEAHVLVTTDFAGHAFTAVLEFNRAAWQIDNVICGNGPVGATTAFYTWYLGYPGDPSSSVSGNPLADGSYREAPFLSETLIAEVDARLEEMAQGPGGYDPFLLAQDYATAFTVRPTETNEEVLVDLYFGDPALNSKQTVLVNLVQEQGRWLLQSIVPAEFDPDYARQRAPLDNALAALAVEPVRPEGEVIVNEGFGFSFQLPVGWVAQPMAIDAPGIPDDWPVQAGYLLMPTEQAEKVAERTGPPSPDEEPLYAPFHLEVVIGNKEAYNRAFIPANFSTRRTINGYPVIVEQEGSGDTPLRYVFRNHEDPLPSSARWIVFSDVVSGFSAREAQALEVAGVLPAILSTFAFAE